MQSAVPYTVIKGGEMKRSWFAGVLTLMCCAALLSPAFAGWYPPSSTITASPGHNVWTVSIGMSRQNVRKVLGQPSQVEDFRGSKRDLWYEGGGTSGTAWYDASYIIVDYASGKAVQIVANLPEAVIQANFSTHSTLAQIQRNFKNIKQSGSFTDVDGKAVVYSDQRQGIGFSFGSDTNHVALSSEPTCFIVFKSGRRISPSWF
jgi:hypothetical protein